MSKFNNYRTPTAAAAFATVAILSVMTFGNNAKASGNPLNCQGATATSVVSCCKEMTSDGLPLWMRQTSTSCSAAVVCRARKAQVIGIVAAAAKTVKRCYIVRIFDEHESHGRGDGGKGGRRGGNNPT